MVNGSLKAALKNARRIRSELPKLIQPSESDFSIAIILDGYEALEARCERYRRALEYYTDPSIYLDPMEIMTDAGQTAKQALETK